jgi:hypothetical protein
MRLGVGGGGTALVMCVALAGFSSATVLLRGNVGEAAPVSLAGPVGDASGGRAVLAVPPTATSSDQARSTVPPVAVPPTTVPPTTTTTAPPPLTPGALIAVTPPHDPASLPALSWGDSGEAVGLLQGRLNQLGFRTTDDPGTFSAGTASAVLALQ